MAAFRSTTAKILHAATADRDRFLPEGPRAIVLEGRPALAWVNIQTAVDTEAGEIHVRFWDGEHRTFAQPARPGFLFPTDREDTLLIGLEKEVGTLHLSTNTFTPMAEIGDSNPRTIINDGEIVPGGRAIVFGTKDLQFSDPVAKIYLFTLDDSQLSILAEGQTCSNGKVFAHRADKLFLYDIDTPLKNVVRYEIDVENRKLKGSVEILDLREESGFPDGMIDAGDGTVIIAFYNPGAIEAGRARRFDLETGECMEEWLTPGSPRVTCPLLIEHENRIHLICTTATEDMSATMRKKCPSAGDLFWTETQLEAMPKTEVVRLGPK